MNSALVVPENPAEQTVAMSDLTNIPARFFESPTQVECISEMTPPKFGKFPELPLELRRHVFKHAVLSDHVRYLPVEITLKEADEEAGFYFTFAVNTKGNPSIPDWPVVDSNISMLSACSESRQVYLEHNQHTLPSGAGSLIRYNTDKTIVHIQNFNSLSRTPKFADTLRAGWSKQRWFSEIKRLAVPAITLILEVGDTRSAWGEYKYGALISAFENLDSLMGVIAPGDLREGNGLFQKQHLEILAWIIQDELQMYKKLNNPNYKIPEVAFFEIVAETEVEDVGGLENIEVAKGASRLGGHEK